MVDQIRRCFALVTWVKSMGSLDSCHDSPSNVEGMSPSVFDVESYSIKKGLVESRHLQLSNCS